MTTTAVVSMDAAGAPRIVKDGTTVTLAAGTTPCSFTGSDGASVVVSPANVVMMSSPQSDGKYYPVIAFPEQTVAVSELTGTWNLLGWERAGAGGLNQPYDLGYGSVVLSSGVASDVKLCSTAADLSGGCTTQTLSPGSALVANPSGGFMGTGDLSGSLVFAYKSASNIFAVLVDPDGSLDILTPQVTESFPAVGAGNTSWNLQPDTSGALILSAGDPMPRISTIVVAITSVDSVNNIVTRNQSNNGGTAVAQTLHYNQPLAGFRKRDAASNVTPVIQLPLPGMGMSVSSRLGATTATTPGTGNGFLTFSIAQP